MDTAKKARLVSLINYQMPGNLKGFLADSEGMFQLAPKVTTVGREGCDFVIKSSGVDFQHAVIEYSDQEQCYVLQDLNSQQGTYVNDCRVQNAVVRLAPGDVIRFGYGGMPYELQLESSSQMTYPPVHQRPAWTSPLAYINDDPQAAGYSPCGGLPLLRSDGVQIPAQGTAGWGNATARQPILPLPPRPPASIRARPQSAGSLGRRSTQTARNGVTGWAAAATSPPARTNSTISVTQVEQQPDKDSQVALLSSEVLRLQAGEADKDTTLAMMRDEVADLQMRLRQCDTQWAPEMMAPPSGRDETVARLAMEAAERRVHMQELELEISRLKSDVSLSEKFTSAAMTDELQTRVVEVNSLRAELERVQKDKRIMAGLVTQMQRDMTNKDTTISRMSKEIENVKKDITEKDIQVKVLHEKFSISSEQRLTDGDVSMRDRELAIIKLRLKNAESQFGTHTELISSVRAELEKTKEQADFYRMKHKTQQTDLETSNEKLQDLERAERIVRVDLEQANKMLQRMKTRVVQAAFCAPGKRAPDHQLTDEELLDALAKMVDEQTEMSRQVISLQSNAVRVHSSRKEMTESTKKLKQQVADIPAKLTGNGLLSSRLASQVELLQCTSFDEPAIWMKEIIVSILQTILAWETDIEKALLEAGFNVNILNEVPADLLRQLTAQKEAAEQEVERLRAREEVHSVQHRDEMSVALAAQRDEMTAGHDDAVTEARQRAEKHLEQTVAEMRAAEAERVMEAAEADQLKIVELETHITQLKARLEANEGEQTVNQTLAKEALERLTEGETREESLRQQLRSLERSQEEERSQLAGVNEEAMKRNATEMERCGETIRQHSLTICAMEERLNKSVKKNKDLQSDNSRLKKSIHELKTKQSLPPAPPPPRPLVIPRPAVDVAALECLIAQLRADNAQLCHQQQLAAAQQQQLLQQQDATVMALRRDLAGTAARLSDMTGELSEAQKEQLEGSKRTMVQQEAELTELRQQMAKLTSIIDKQTTEIEELNKDISKQKTALGKSKLSRSGQEALIAELENALAQKEAESSKQIGLIEDEGRISSELSALGAQCRGERHDQVISRQREALTELRGRIREAEHMRPPVPTHDQALQQVLQLKKELSELHASHCVHAMPLGGGGGSGGSGGMGDALQRQISAARGGQPQTEAASQVERSAHRETLESLENSEATYLSLLRGVAGVLEVDGVAGLHSLAHMPRDERARLCAEREQSREELTGRIAVLKERVARKDELLQGYERDLAKLRQAEMLADTKHAQVENLAIDVRARTEETGYLRESLQRTREKLDQEKRLNASIKQKKTFHLENEQVRRNGWPKHHCVPDDVMGKEINKKNLQKERIKRKNYEIETLKGELRDKDKDLQLVRRKITNVDSGMVL